MFQGYFLDIGMTMISGPAGNGSITLHRRLRRRRPHHCGRVPRQPMAWQGLTPSAL